MIVALFSQLWRRRVYARNNNYITAKRTIYTEPRPANNDKLQAPATISKMKVLLVFLSYLLSTLALASDRGMFVDV